MHWQASSLLLVPPGKPGWEGDRVFFYVNEAAFGKCLCGRGWILVASGASVETFPFRLGLQPTWLALEASQNPPWDSNSFFFFFLIFIRIIHLVPGLTEAQILGVSSQKEFRETK